VTASDMIFVPRFMKTHPVVKQYLCSPPDV